MGRHVHRKGPLMSASFSRPRPQPWQRLGHSLNPELARLLGAVYRRRRLLAAWYPLVPAPPARIGGIGCRRSSYPVGALILIWCGWDYARGPCAECGGRGLGYDFAGGLASGRVLGVCARCGTMLERFVGGLVRINNGIEPALEGTAFRFTGLPEPTTDWAPAALVAVLGELGETGLPDPRSLRLTQLHAPGRRAQ